jgi:hypothetical protein
MARQRKARRESNKKLKDKHNDRQNNGHKKMMRRDKHLIKQMR